jgi:uncharacterized protein YndB with AHSA1/START domain
MIAGMGRYRFIQEVAAPPEVVFDLWTDVDRLHEWTGGVTRVTDVSLPIGRAGAGYTVWFGRMASPTVVLEAERPHLFATRFGNRLLRGESRATFEPTGTGTRLSQELVTEGLVPAIMARLFALGSWNGSFRGELAAFARIAEREVKTAS